MITELQKRIEQMTDMLRAYQSGELMPSHFHQIADSVVVKSSSAPTGIAVVSTPASCIGKSYRVILVPE